MGVHGVSIIDGNCIVDVVRWRINRGALDPVLGM